MKRVLTRIRRIPALLAAFTAVSLLVAAPAYHAHALTNPQSGSTGLTGSIGSAPPSTAATISTPSNGQTFTTLPITVAGLCTTGLLVKVFDNNVFMGSVVCVGGSYSIKIDLFSGRNDIVARVFDALDQAGPDSNIVTVTFNDQQFNTTGSTLMYLTSNYAQRGANPGETLTWPIILTGGTGPYAISVDWGDNKASDLLSQQFAGVFNIQHVYDTAGTYTVTIKATDKNGLAAYLQLVAIANGAITSSTTSTSNKPSVITITKVLWAPAAVMLPLILIGFWLGRRYELASLRKHLENVDY
ncbi:MAG: hypothetical protein ACQR33_05535 [Candidatus Saccharibacteria bacterium]